MIVKPDDQVFDYFLYHSRMNKAEEGIQPFLKFMRSWKPGGVQ